MPRTSPRDPTFERTSYSVGTSLLSDPSSAPSIFHSSSTSASPTSNSMPAASNACVLARTGLVEEGLGHELLGGIAATVLGRVDGRPHGLGGVAGLGFGGSVAVVIVVAEEEAGRREGGDGERDQRHHHDCQRREQRGALDRRGRLPPG